LEGLEAGDPGLDAFRSVIESRRREVAEQVARYRGERDPVALRGRTAVVVDDGIATGYTFAAALAIARGREPRRLLASAPAASWEGAKLVSRYCDEMILAGTAQRGLFFAVSLYFQDFPQVSDEEVVELLASRGPDRPPAGPQVG
jgi:predicted phosphoribosyltransferase